MNTDGNLAALHQYEREQDALEAAGLNIEALQLSLSIDLFEAYVTKNHAVIDEVNDSLTDSDVIDNLIDKLREAVTEECKRPEMGRGCLLYSAYEKVVDEVCRDIAGRYTTGGEIEAARKEFEL